MSLDSSQQVNKITQANNEVNCTWKWDITNVFDFESESNDEEVTCLI